VELKLDNVTNHVEYFKSKFENLNSNNKNNLIDEDMRKKILYLRNEAEYERTTQLDNNNNITTKKIFYPDGSKYYAPNVIENELAEYQGCYNYNLQKYTTNLETATKKITSLDSMLNEKDNYLNKKREYFKNQKNKKNQIH